MPRPGMIQLLNSAFFSSTWATMSYGSVGFSVSPSVAGRPGRVNLVMPE
jgi:hypothetical protein